MGDMKYSLQTAEKHIKEAIDQVHIGKQSMEEAMREVVARTLNEWQETAHVAYDCCGCSYDETVCNEMPDVIAALRKQAVPA